MFIYTNDTIYNMDHIASMSVSIYRGEKLTCPSISIISSTGKLYTIVKCNTTDQCHKLLINIKGCIDRNENYTLDEFELETISIHALNSTMKSKTFYVPKQEPTILLDRFSINPEVTGTSIRFDSSLIYFYNKPETAQARMDSFESFIYGNLTNDNTFTF